MNYRTLGSSELQVSEISLGSWLTYAGGVGLEQSRACTDAAFDAGINFFDTANVYGQGAAETAWGEIVSGRPRDSYIPATKVWGPMSDDPTDQGLSAAQIHKQIDASLECLRTDYVDLYQAHRFDSDVPIEETLEALGQVAAAGKARYLGVSEWTIDQIQAAVAIVGADFFASSQPQYSMLWQAPETELFDACTPLGISHIVWSPLAQGVLTGFACLGTASRLSSRVVLLVSSWEAGASSTCLRLTRCHWMLLRSPRRLPSIRLNHSIVCAARGIASVPNLGAGHESARGVGSANSN